MLEGLKPYPEYKDSGSRWLEDVPTHWEVRNLRTLLRKTTERNRADLPLLSVAREKGVFVRSLTDTSENHNVIPEDLSNYKVARQGSLVINKMKAWQGSMGIAPCDGIVSPAYFVYDLNIENEHFAEKLFRSKPYVAHFGQASDGVRVGQWDLSISGMKEIPALLPPPEEQVAIVRFLDHANRKIDRFIRGKQKLIKLLNEQKQAIIHQAVTKGLDPTVPMKDSGIPWLGEIPAHWDLTPNRGLMRVRKVLVGARHPEFTLLSLTKEGVIVRDLSESKGKFSSDLGTSQEVRSGDLVTCLFDVPETPRTVGLSKYQGMITGAYTVLEPIENSPMQWLEAFYIAMDDRKMLSPLYSGLRNTIPKPRFLGAKTPIPPRSEITQILDYIENGLQDIRKTTTRTQRQIALMQEYRTRLTADVVTGKLDVREAASRLPDLSDEELPPVGNELEEDEMELEEVT